MGLEGAEPYGAIETAAHGFSGCDSDPDTSRRGDGNRLIGELDLLRRAQLFRSSESAIDGQDPVGGDRKIIAGDRQGSLAR